ncbi:protein kinase domain-containing protein [Neptuniibacter sp. PT34_22]|uniref:protein kinase domain-containing protein n=1 Tax=Neptuniibacter sp. PT34_22 TaxID=3398205 RepID=UPI0039F4B5A4
MELFKAELQRYIRSETDLQSLKTVIQTTLISDSKNADRIKEGLTKLVKAGHLEAAVAKELTETVDYFVARHKAPSPEAVTEDATEIAAEDQTQIAANPTSDPEDQTVVAKTEQAAMVNDGEDQTRIAQQEDATQIVRSDDATKIDVAGDRSGFTSPTSRTSNTSTTAKWSKPFEGESDKTDHTLNVGSIIKDRFRLIEFIGCGGMGDVFKAEDQRRIDAQDVETLIAIKVLNNNFRDHPESLRSLQREARKTQNLAHPNIVNVFDFDRDQHHVYMTMELMLGEPLNKVIKANPKGLALDTVFRYVAEMGAALSYAHRRDIVHSDFKPSNIFLDQNTIKVFDFGIARAAKEGQADTFDAGELGALTPNYASPEMLEGVFQADPKDDIYALACITYELLTGKHPFTEKGKKVPADQARDKGLAPAPIKSLKRKQWKALKQGLSFDPALRTHSVDQFLQGFLPETQQAGLLAKWYVWPLAATVLSALAYFPVRDFLDEKELDDLADELKNGSESDILNWLGEVESMPEEERIRYFNDTRVKSSLTKFFISRMNDQINEDQYAEAERVAARALQIYEDSRRLSDQRELVSKRKAGRLNELNIELNNYLSSELNVFIEKIEQFPKLFDSIKRVDHKNPMLEDPRVPHRMVEAVDLLAEQNQFERAETVSGVAKGIFPENQAIIVADNQMKQLKGRFEQAKLISNYEKELASVDKLTQLSDLSSFKKAVSELNRLAPQSKTLIQFKNQASPIIEGHLAKMMTEAQWFSAKDQFAQYQLYLNDGVSNDLSQKIEEGIQSYQTSLAENEKTILKAIEQGNLTKAERLLDQFEAPSEIKQTVATRLAKAYLKDARIAREKSQWEQSISLIEKARSINTDAGFSQLLDTELQIIEQNRNASSSGDMKQLKAEREAEIADYQKQLNVLLTQPLNSSLLNDVQHALDKVEQLRPDHPLLKDIPQRFASSYLNQAEQLEQQGNLKGAAELLTEYNTAFPDNPQIETALNTFDQGLAEQAQSERFNQLKQDISQQLSQVSQNANWESELNQSLKEIGSLGATEHQIASLNTNIALQLSKVASQYSDEKRFSEALDLLAKAETFDPSLGTLKGLEQQITASQAAWEKDKQIKKQQAEVQGLKQTLQTQLQANDLPRAEQSYKQLQKMLGENDPYIQSEANPAFVETYLRLADQLARQTRLSKAAQLLESAKKYSVDTTVIDEKIAGYNRDAKLWRIGQAIRSISYDSFVLAHQQLTEIEPELEDERAKKLHTDLTNAVLKRYEQLKGSRAEAANKLIRKAKELYPDHAEIQKIKLNKLATKPPEPEPPEPKPEPVKTEEAKPEVTEPKPSVQPPKVTATGKACSPSLAGLGRNVKAVCYDMVSQQTKAPYMIVIPSGAGGPFAISKFEISIDDYNAYCKQTGCSVRSGSGRSPVTGVSQSQAVAYAKWLTQVTGHQYRLPKYKQWKHAALSGNKRQPNNFNCRLMQGDTILKGHAPVSVRSGSANNWGMINYLGNVQEWVIHQGVAKAAGGHYADKMSNCSVDLVRNASADSKTGFRLVRSL